MDITPKYVFFMEVRCGTSRHIARMHEDKAESYPEKGDVVSIASVVDGSNTLWEVESVDHMFAGCAMETIFDRISVEVDALFKRSAPRTEAT